MPENFKIVMLSGFGRIKGKDHPAMDDDFYYVASWAGTIARRLKKFNPNLNIEVWRAEPDFSHVAQRDIFSIRAVIFPYKGVLVRNLLTYAMYKQIKLLKREANIIIHLHDLFNFRFVLFLSIVLPQVKLILSHHGGILPKKGSLKDILFRYVYKNSRIAHITILTPAARNYISSIKDHPPLTFLPVGADFEQFKQINKREIRKELGLDQDKIYGIYVGSFYRLKSVDLILETYRELKLKYNFSVIFVGGENTPDNELFDEVVDSGCPWFGKNPWTDMVKYYNAADFYIHPAFHPSFGGIDVSWMEALACNIPVLSPQLHYLDFDFQRIGIAIDSKNEILKKTEMMIKNCHYFTDCREIALKHLDGNGSIMKKLDKIYNDVLAE
jgi:glycosyltransferase involved in cell wall biosynthesis